MKIPALLVVGAVSALTLSACANSGSTDAATTGAASSATPSAHGLHVASTSLGQVVVDAQGRTVYMLTADSANHATCDAGCQQYWPPVTTPGRGAGVTAAIGSTPLPGGGSTGTVGGWPVYTYSGDQGPGEVNGEGVAAFGGTWYAVSPGGTPVTHAGPSSTTSSPAYPGRGY